MYLQEAFRALDALNEDTFSVSDDGISKLAEFQNNDDLTDEVKVIDPEAETEEDLQDSYVGKIILDCSVCHSKLYKDKEEIELNEDGTMANVGEECPYCYTSDGFKVIGEVASFGGESTDDEEVVENDDDAEALEEALGVGAGIALGGAALGAGMIGASLLGEDDEDLNDQASQDQDVKESLTQGSTESTTNEKDEEDNSLTESYEDVDGIMGEKGTKWTDDQLKKYFEAEKDNDPVLKSYNGDADKWFQDTTKGMKKVNEGIFSSTSVLMHKQGNGWEPVATGEHTAKFNQFRDAYIHKYGGETSDFKIVSEKDAKKLSKVYKNRKKSLPNVDKSMPSWAKSFDKKAIDAEKERQRGAEVAKRWGEVEANERKAKKEYERDRYNSIKGSNVSNTDKAGVHYSGGDYYSEDLNEKVSKKYVQALKDKLAACKTKEDLAKLIGDDVDDLSDKYIDRILSGKITNRDINKLFEIGFTDDDQEYADWYLKNIQVTNESKPIKESVNNVNVETDDSIVNVSADENGKVTVTTEPNTAADVEAGEEVITPVSPETQAEIEMGSDEASAEDEFVDMDVEEFDEESFDDLGESYLKKVYENVDSYKTTSIKENGNSIVVEGVINFKSGKAGKTSFLFEAKDCTKDGRVRFVGENAQLTKGKKSFTISGTVADKKFITESFNYNYRAKDKDGKSSRIYGTIKK